MKDIEAAFVARVGSELELKTSPAGKGRPHLRGRQVEARHLDRKERAGAHRAEGLSLGASNGWARSATRWQAARRPFKTGRLGNKRSATCRRGIVAISEKKATSTRPVLGDGGLAWLHFHPPWLDFGARSGVRPNGPGAQDQFRVLASDIAEGGDFLKLERLPDASVRGIVTNPPYEPAEEFCAHALKLTAPVRGFVAMLLRCDFDHAKRRAYLFADCPQFAKKIVLTRRIVWFVEADGKPKASPVSTMRGFCGTGSTMASRSLPTVRTKGSPVQRVKRSLKNRRAFKHATRR
jgi:hypothetical protein